MSAQRPGSDDSGEHGEPGGPDGPEGPDGRDGGLDADDAAAWRDLVERFDRASEDAEPRWPASEDVDPDRADPDGPDPGQDAGGQDPVGRARDGRLLRPGRPVGASAPPPPGPRDHVAPEEPDRWVPPEPPPLPRGDTPTRFAWAGLVGGPLLVLGLALAGIEAPVVVVVAAVIAFVAGFVTLVVRMEDGDPPDDDGAVV